MKRFRTFYLRQFKFCFLSFYILFLTSCGDSTTIPSQVIVIDLNSITPTVTYTIDQTQNQSGNFGMQITTNVVSTQVYSNVLANNKALQSAQNKLSTGYRINKAADDASGLSIANALSSQTRGISGVYTGKTPDTYMILTNEALSPVGSTLVRMNDSVQVNYDPATDTLTLTQTGTIDNSTPGIFATKIGVQFGSDIVQSASQSIAFGPTPSSCAVVANPPEIDPVLPHPFACQVTIGSDIVPCTNYGTLNWTYDPVFLTLSSVNNVTGTAIFNCAQVSGANAVGGMLAISGNGTLTCSATSMNCN